MTYLFVVWLVLGVAVLSLALYRKLKAADEDDVIHLGEGQNTAIQKQGQLAKQLDVIDRWGKTLTAVEVLFGMGLAAAYLYSAWVESAQVH